MTPPRHPLLRSAAGAALLLVALCATVQLPAADRAAPGTLASPHASLTGTWKFDPARSTELSPWRDYVLTITVEGDRVSFARQLGAGRRGFADSMSIDVSQPQSIVPVEMWPDNRHLGAYIGGDKTKRVQATWLDHGRILRLSTDLVLSTSQGDRAINILSDYKVSANGAVLTLTELRSTRNQPIVYTFTRVEPSVP